jgi:undecaprenyl diphosphate synthase
LSSPHTIDTQNLPRHIAVIMDGNGRWAKKRFLPRTAGHKAGAKAVRNIIENCVAHKIAALTLFAFSSENWQRPDTEVETLMDLFLTHLKGELPLFQKHNIQLRVVGELSRFSSELQQQIAETAALTQDNTGLVLSIAASYGGCWDIVQAAKKISAQVKAGAVALDDITEDMFAQQLCLADLPAPDLFIRTGGEQRISNFMLWQLAYTELYFTDIYWPDFATENFTAAIQFYQERCRRFGKINEA